MTILAATPYLILHGKASQAIAFYQQALQAQVETQMRFGDMDASCPAAQRDRIMHAALKVGSATLMLSDGDTTGDEVVGAKVEIALHLDDVEQAQRCFAALADGGTVREQLKAAPWGALFGALVDQFGVRWMFNVDVKQG